MKTTNRILLVAAVTAAFTLNADVRGSESVSPPRILVNRALAASPRYIEVHPELLRIPQSVEESEIKAAQIRKQMAKLLENRAFATSPRFLEAHPELLRPPTSTEEDQAKAARINKQMAKLMENRAWAASPRVREAFPWLLRGGVSP
jgi:hypothetical protein